MWRQSGNLVSYLYYPTKTGNCGQDFAWKGAGLSSEYQTITVYVKVNDPGEYLSTKTEFHVFRRNFHVALSEFNSLHPSRSRPSCMLLLWLLTP
jgi:hypothetical protein